MTVDRQGQDTVLFVQNGYSKLAPKRQCVDLIY